MIDPDNSNAFEHDAESFDDTYEAEPSGTLPPGPFAGEGCARILVVDENNITHETFRRSLHGMPIEFDFATNIEQCRAFLDAGTYDVIVVDADVHADAFALVESVTAGPQAISAVVTCECPTLSVAVDAMRSGAIDLVAKPFSAEEIADRLASALAHASRLRNKDRRVARLQRICKRLNNARAEANKQVDVLCDNLVDAYHELADKMDDPSFAGEYSALIRQELDVEALLRTTLEFLLTKTGPTNAAVYLPTGHEDYNLGAYVNYDIPKDTADVLLDQLADIMAQPFSQTDDIVYCTTNAQLETWIGSEAHWLEGSGVITFSCCHEGECLAIMSLFRDARSPFTDETLEQLSALRDLFAEQLARVVRIHHRHIDSDHWPGFDVETEDDDFDIGGLAA